MSFFPPWSPFRQCEADSFHPMFPLNSSFFAKMRQLLTLTFPSHLMALFLFVMTKTVLANCFPGEAKVALSFSAGQVYTYVFLLKPGPFFNLSAGIGCTNMSTTSLQSFLISLNYMRPPLLSGWGSFGHPFLLDNHAADKLSSRGALLHSLFLELALFLPVISTPLVLWDWKRMAS